MADAVTIRTEKDLWPQSLQAETLMAHMRVLCEEIGPRPPTSVQERRASAYGTATLQAMGYRQIQTHTFKSQGSYGWIVITPGLCSIPWIIVKARKCRRDFHIT